MQGIQLTAEDHQQERPQYWRPMRTCVPGRSVQLPNPGARPVYGAWDGKDPQWLAWAPLPEIPPEGLAS